MEMWGSWILSYSTKSTPEYEGTHPRSTFADKNASFWFEMAKRHKNAYHFTIAAHLSAEDMWDIIGGAWSTQCHA
jgi:hypothetical protein